MEIAVAVTAAPTTFSVVHKRKNLKRNIFRLLRRDENFRTNKTCLYDL